MYYYVRGKDMYIPIMKYNISNIVAPTQRVLGALREINFTGFYIILFALAMDKFIFSRIADALC